MELSKIARKSTKNPIPVIGIESMPEFDSKDKFFRTAECAYYKAEARGFKPGHEMEDWLAAETEADQ